MINKITIIKFIFFSVAPQEQIMKFWIKIIVLLQILQNFKKVSNVTKFFDHVKKKKKSERIRMHILEVTGKKIILEVI